MSSVSLHLSECPLMHCTILAPSPFPLKTNWAPCWAMSAQQTQRLLLSIRCGCEAQGRHLLSSKAEAHDKPVHFICHLETAKQTFLEVQSCIDWHTVTLAYMSTQTDNVLIVSFPLCSALLAFSVTSSLLSVTYSTTFQHGVLQHCFIACHSVFFLTLLFTFLSPFLSLHHRKLGQWSSMWPCKSNSIRNI